MKDKIVNEITKELLDRGVEAVENNGGACPCIWITKRQLRNFAAQTTLKGWLLEVLEDDKISEDAVVEVWSE